MFGYALVMAPLITGLVITAGIFLVKKFGSGPGVVISIIVGVVMSGIMVPSSYAITRTIAQNASVGGYHEYWNGWETAAVREDRECYRDGSCRNTYECDSYQVPVTETYTDSKGNTQTRTRMETRWHSCPYSQQETTFTVETTVDDVVIADNLMTGEPFRWSKSIPGGRQGEPQEWLNAKARTESNNPAPATFDKKYENYLHGTNDATFKLFEGKVAEMREKGLIPDLVEGLNGHYSANKVYTAGKAPAELKDRYSDDVSKLNGAFGDSLQGDLHVVFVPANTEYSPTDYADTLLAYWQSKEMGKRTLSKNALVVVMGVEGDAVEWADARTGMPVGNDALRVEIRDTMTGLSLDDKLIGNPTYDIPNSKLVHSDGHLEGLLWGENTYQRVSMSGDGESGSGFLYLKDSIVPTTRQLIIAGFIVLLLTSLLLFGAGALYVRTDTRF